METNKLALCTQGNGIFMHKQHNTYKTHTAPHEWMRSPMGLGQVRAGSKGKDIRGRSKPSR